MNNIIKIILLPIIFTFYTFGSDYYISNSGSDSNSGTSISSPWKTISKVNSILLKPGDRISFRRGNIWKEKLNISYSGTSNNPIYIGAYGTGENPVFDGNNEFQYLISLKTDVSYITIDGLFLKNCDPQYSGGARGIIYSNSNNHNLIIKNCYFRQDKISTSSSYAVIYGKDPSYVLIDSCDFSGGSIMVYFRSNNSNHRDVHHIVVTNNYFHEINARLNTGSQYDGQFGIGIKLTMNFLDGIGEVLGSEGIVRDVNITDNRFYKLSGDAIYHEDTRNTRLTTTDFPAGVPIWLVAGRTSYNINIERNWAKLVEWCFVDWGRITDRGGLFPWSNCSYNTIDSCGFDFDGNPTTRYPTNAINTHAWKQVYIENNTISNVATNSGDGKGIILDFSCNSQLFICDSTIVRNNIVSGTGVNSKLNFASAIMLSSAIRCSVYNNICFDNKAGIAIARPTCFDNLVFNNTLDNNDYGFWYGCKTTGNVIKNNAITNNKYFGINNNTNLIYDYNGFYNNGKDYSYGTPGKNDVFSDPHYFDAIHHNYRLDSTSAYIGKGADMGLTFDIINSPRKNNIDIGAFQFNQSYSFQLGG